MCWSNGLAVDWLVVEGTFVTVDVVGGEVAVDGIGGESVIVKNPVPENNCFLNPRIFSFIQLTPVEHVARIADTEHQEYDKNKHLDSSIYMASRLDSFHSPARQIS